MPTLPIDGPIPLSGGPVPVQSSADVLALLPVDVRRSVSAPVRDALVAALTAILQEYQRRSSQGAGCADILRAEGDELAALASDHQGFKQPGESDESLRARVLGIADLVTPETILAAVNAILAPFTTIEAKYFESEVDQWFVHDGTVTAWDSFVYDDEDAASPRYPDRLYVDDEDENGGDSIEARQVLGAWAFTDGLGRYFVLRIPPLEAVDDSGTYAFSSDTVDDGMFVADGSDTGGSESSGAVTSFVFTDQVQSDELYAAIVSTVDLLRGQGIRWQAYVDPYLT